MDDDFSDQPIKDLENLIRDHCIANSLRQSEIMTALTVTMYQIAIVSAAQDNVDPTDYLRRYIDVLEEGWGSYIKCHARSIAELNAAARKRP